MVGRVMCRAQGWFWLALLSGRVAAAQVAQRPVLELTGRGVQVYACEASKEGQAPMWVLKRPEAKLVDADGQVVGTHEAGPVWRYKDGSAIYGEAVSKRVAPEPDAVPWLVLRGVKPEGKGVLSEVVEIRREETHGGVAPARGCGAGDAGTERQVPYSAVYRFFRAAGR